MLIPKLILFEGPPGAGKSTLSEYLANQLQLHDVQTDWIEEHMLESRYLMPFLNEEEHRVEALIQCWTNLAAEIAGRPGVTIMDGGYFGNTTKFLIAKGVAQAQIDAYVARLHQLLQPLNPLVVYLSGNVEQIMQRAIQVRGQNWAEMIATDVAGYPYQQALGRTGLDGMVAFFVDSYRYLDAILPTCPWPQVQINTADAAWSTYQTDLLTALGITELPIPKPLQVDPSCYVGTYRPPASFPEPYNQPFQVEATQAGLMLHMYFRRNFQLVPQTATHFRIRSAPWQVEFLLNEHGEAHAVVYPFVTGTRHLCVRQTSHTMA